MDLESEVVPFDLRSGMCEQMQQQVRSVPRSMARNALHNTRRAGKEGQSDFEVIDRVIRTIPQRRSLRASWHHSFTLLCRVLVEHPA